MFIETATAIPQHLTMHPAWRGLPVGDATEDSEGTPAVWRATAGWAFGYLTGAVAIVGIDLADDIGDAIGRAISATRDCCALDSGTGEPDA